ncbi:MAG: hypothetical protein ACXW4H_00345 [Candidatus Limnocylindrales bacterium]
MLNLQELLRRFRPLVVAPGRAGPATVPVDRTADLMAELTGVFASIDAIDDEAERVEEDARHRAGQVEVAARSRATRLTSNASERAAAENAAAYAERRELHEDAIHLRLAAATEEARRIERTSRERTPACIDNVLRCVLLGPPD